MLLDREKMLKQIEENKQIANELYWTPTETFDSGIRKTVEWYLNNMEWCSRVQDGSYLRFQGSSPQGQPRDSRAHDGRGSGNA